TSGGVIERLRRVAVVDGTLPPPLPTALAILGDPAWPCAAAFGTSVAPARVPFVWRPEPDANRAVRITRLRLGLAMSVMLAAAIAALCAPGIRGARFAREAS